MLRQARSFLLTCPTAKWFRDEERLPTEAQSAAIAECLRPSFEVFEKPGDRRSRQKSELVRFTEEQYAALDAMAANPRALFTGPAGTGKTVLAMETANALVLSERQGALRVFQPLARQVALQARNAFGSEALNTETLHQYMLGVAGRCKLHQMPLTSSGLRTTGKRHHEAP